MMRNQPASMFGLTGGQLAEREVSVPGPLSVAEIRGALPIRDGRIDFAGLIENPFYRPA
ncbi:hypothetical protein [Rhizosaccharibacter radicis]|uniref:Uncharacterized protein n=1 Tax=Rhizosaccharibacter radicis TaxID=2782605 RepID=A0ABT1VYW4_9PROT|nr:hypothetical protein [Acetobacteraceae bacterium KSS12]